MIALPPELAAAVVANTEADAPRLACADWLDEHGDAEWAEMIRVQCALARPDPLRKRAEAGRLATREKALEKTLRERLRRLIEHPPTGHSGRFTAVWHRGFVRRFVWEYRVTPALWRALPLLPAVEELCALGMGGLGPGELATAGGLKALTSLELTLAPNGPLAFADVVPLAGLPRLRRLLLSAPGSRLSLVPPEVADQLTAERERHAGPRDSAAVLAELRPLCVRVDVSEAGDVWAMVQQVYGPDAGRRADLFAALPSLRGVFCVGTPLPDLGRSPGLRSLYSPLRNQPVELPHGPTDVRELHTSLAGADGPALLAWAARQPRLSALSLSVDSAGVLDPSPLSGAPALRVLHAPVLRWSVPGLVVPNLVELSLGVRTRLEPAEVRRAFPSLRYLAVRRTLTDEATAEMALLGIAVVPDVAYEACGQPPVPASWSAWPRQDIDGVSLAVPPWPRRDPTPAADPRFPDVVPLGLWREWGDPDSSDDDLFFGPAVLRLERLRRKVKAAERRAVLLETGTGFPVAKAGGVQDVTPEGGTRHFALRTADASGRWAWRFLWASGDSAVRLVVRAGPMRCSALELLARRVAESLQLA